MSFTLSEFSVKGLHGITDFTIPIENNILILVGENGIGKSTIVNMLFYFLTRQWDKLYRADFKSVQITINGHELSLNKDEIKSHLIWSGQFAIEDPKLRNRMAHIFATFTKDSRQLSMFSDENSFKEYCRMHRIPASYVQECISELKVDPNSSKKILNISDMLRKLIPAQIFFLPTYRRIEHELKFVFPHLERQLDKYGAELSQSSESAGYIELVRFGMDDVKTLINTKMSELEKHRRSQLQELAGSYLREVLTGTIYNVPSNLVRKLSEHDYTELVLQGIHNDIINDDEKTIFASKIKSLQGKQKLAKYDKVLIHFFLKMVTAYAQEKQREEHVNKFVDVCNNYLRGKAMKYDNEQFKIQIYRTDSKDSVPIELDMLSSGEKQIISLLSHIYLSEHLRYFLIIDEPELSLSVPWQKKLLVDIVNSGSCDGLISVTHSPFIFENELDKYAHSLEEFMAEVA